MNEFLFLRHGQTDWNFQNRIMGQNDVPLNTTGIKQAKAVSQLLKDIKFAAIVTSPIRRAMETAEIIIKNYQNLKLIIEKDLSEVDYGNWIGKTVSEVKKEFPEALNNYYNCTETMAIPGGERLVDACNRAVNVAIRHRKNFPEGRILFVSHADIIKLAIIGLLKLPMTCLKSFSIDNGAIIILRATSSSDNASKGMRIIMYNPLNGIDNDL